MRDICLMLPVFLLSKKILFCLLHSDISDIVMHLSVMMEFLKGFQSFFLVFVCLYFVLCVRFFMIIMITCHRHLSCYEPLFITGLLGQTSSRLYSSLFMLL